MIPLSDAAIVSRCMVALIAVAVACLGLYGLKRRHDNRTPEEQRRDVLAWVNQPKRKHWFHGRSVTW